MRTTPKPTSFPFSSPGLRPLCLAGVSGSAVKECLIIRSVQPQIQKKTPDGQLSDLITSTSSELDEAPAFTQVSACLIHTHTVSTYSKITQLSRNTIAHRSQEKHLFV